MKNALNVLAKVVLLIILLYVFLLSIKMMGSSFKLFGKDAADSVMGGATSNPFIGLLIGILATSLVQSSSTVTSMIVAVVAAGTISVPAAIPMIMGANIGTTITNTLVSLSHVTQKHEFKRAFSAATVHDFFNLMAVALLLPLELITRAIFGRGIIESAATKLSSFVVTGEDIKYFNPVKAYTKPVIKWLQHSMEGMGWSNNVVATILLILSFILIFSCLFFLTKLLKSMMISKMEVFFDRFIGKHALIGIALGIIMTVMVQSSSITTSLLIPMAGAGIINIRQIFPVTLGANLGTTITALLASLGAGGSAGLTIALCHLLFNVFGILLIYPIPFMRNIPIKGAEKIAEIAVHSKLIVVLYISGVFFVVPGIFVAITHYFF